MHFLLTNDDGIDAPGLAALADSLDGFGTFTIVAPHEHLSGCSHQVTTTRAITARACGEGRWALDGTPADCVRVGLLHLAPPTEWVLSGVNHGGNLGVDIPMSGTVAAVREAAFLGRPGIAFSQYRRQSGEYPWHRAVPMVRRVLERLLPHPPRGGAFWNVNLPDLEDPQGVPEIVVCPVDCGALPVRYEHAGGVFQYRGVYRDRPRTRGSDVDVCFSGHIAVSQVLPLQCSDAPLP